jgi:hypothetical protein
MLPDVARARYPAGKAPRSGADAVKASYLLCSAVAAQRVCVGSVHTVAMALAEER